jgi:hypothetical protein
MRLHPPVSEDEALEWLKVQAKLTWGVESTAQVEASLKPVAAAMAAVSATVLPEDVEPLLL